MAASRDNEMGKIAEIPTSAASDLLTEQTRMGFRQTLTGDLGLMVAAVLLAFLLWGEVDSSRILLWLAISLPVSLGNLLLLYVYWKSSPPPEASGVWMRRWFVGMILDSSAWGLGMVLIFPSTSTTHQMVLGLVVIGIGLATVAAFSIITWAPQISISLLTLPLSVTMLLQGTPDARILGLLLLVYLATMIYFNHNLHRTTTRALRISNENARLAADLTTELGEHARMEVALRESEQKFRALVENALDGIILIKEGRIVYANSAARKIVGLPDDEAEVVDYTAFSPDDIVKRFLRDRYRGHMEGEPMPAQFETQVVRSDGEVVDVIVASSVIQTAGEPRTLATIKDMSEFKKIESIKREFVAVVSHELKNPLSSIMASLQMVANGLTGEISEDSRKMVEIAYQNSERLTRLADSLLLAHRLDFGRTDFQMIPLDMERLVRTSVEQARPRFRETGLKLETAEPGRICMVEGDQAALQQVLENLLSNAAKFSPRGGMIRAMVKSAGDSVRVEVSDQGPGIPLDFRGRVFEKFAKAYSPDGANTNGSGLGLSISKSIVEAHQGRIGFEHPATGGVTFFFELPSAKAF